MEEPDVVQGFSDDAGAIEALGTAEFKQAGDKVNFVAALAAPVGERDLHGVVAGGEVLKDRRFGGDAEDGLTFEQDGGGDGDGGQVDFVATAQHLLSIAVGLRAADEMGGLQQFDEVPGGGAPDFEVATEGRHVEQPAIMHAEVENRILNNENAPDTEEGRDIPFANVFDDVLAEEALGLSDALSLSGLREAARSRYSWQCPT